MNVLSRRASGKKESCKVVLLFLLFFFFLNTEIGLNLFNILGKVWLSNNRKSTKQTCDFEYINTKCMTMDNIFHEQREMDGSSEKQIQYEKLYLCSYRDNPYYNIFYPQY